VSETIKEIAGNIWQVDMEQEQIIPTRHRSRIPYTLSYPIGAKAISVALAGVPQFAELKIEFSFSERTHLQVTAKSYPVIKAQFSGPTRLFADLSGWTIRVEPVPRSLRHAVQTKIVAEALPAIRSWLLANSHSMEREGGHGLIFSFDELKAELTSEEHASIAWQTPRA
jgi:hypothetical protein